MEEYRILTQSLSYSLNHSSSLFDASGIEALALWNIAWSNVHSTHFKSFWKFHVFCKRSSQPITWLVQNPVFPTTSLASTSKPNVTANKLKHTKPTQCSERFDKNWSNSSQKFPLNKQTYLSPHTEQWIMSISVTFYYELLHQMTSTW